MTQVLKSTLKASLLLVCLVSATHSRAADGIAVRDAWSRTTPPGTTVGAAYFVIVNRGARDRLLRISTPIAERAELHVSAMVGGMMTMKPLEMVEIERNATVTFAPGGRHVMLIGLQRPIKAGDKIPLTLTFEKSGPVQTTVPVLPLGQTPNSLR